MREELKTALAENAADLVQLLDRLLTVSELGDGPVHEAMRYACLNGGKRLRPLLVTATAQLFGVQKSRALRTAAAVEMVHCYSLIHDDLPAMDDSDLRRGRSAVHKAFDEATAILAGDALLTQAFEVLADPETHEDPGVRCALVAGLAKAAGPHGMVAGQMLDLIAEKQEFDLGATTRLQRLKTGEMIAFACEAGAILGKATAPLRHALRAYAHDIGLAFQIADDLLDVEGTEAETGKPVGHDAGKATFVSILGPERARAQAQALTEQALQYLKVFDGRATLLEAVAEYVLTRRA
jgi:farnesyl diphosphate synthase